LSRGFADGAARGEVGLPGGGARASVLIFAKGDEDGEVVDTLDDGPGDAGARAAEVRGEGFAPRPVALMRRCLSFACSDKYH
jgi:hypothetical protein